MVMGMSYLCCGGLMGLSNVVNGGGPMLFLLGGSCLSFVLLSISRSTNKVVIIVQARSSKEFQSSFILLRYC